MRKGEWWLNSMKRGRPSLQRWSTQQGQAFLFIVILIAFFLLAVLGLATDYTQVWAHRQMAQGAADAACEAGAADVFLKGTDPTASTDFPALDFSWIGSSFDCSAKPNSVPCEYASFNGYAGANVSVSFPASLPGVSGIPAGFGTIANPYLKVTVTDPVATYFTRIGSSITTVNVTASASCGLNVITAPVPLVVLHRTASPSLQVNGTASVTILGGPQRSVQVDSSSATAVSVGTVDLHQAGPTNNGSDFAVFGGPAAKPTGVNVGTAGHWIPGANPFGDPFAAVAAPTSAPATAGTATPVPFAVNGCPDPVGCVEFTPGNYASCSTGPVAPGANACLNLPFGGSRPRFNRRGTNWQANTAYAVGALILPSACTSNGFVYMAIAVTGNSGSASIGSSSGGSSACTSVTQGPGAASGTPNNCVVGYQISGTLSPAATGYVPSVLLRCPSGSATPSQVPATIPGNVLLGPCGGTSGIGATGQYGSPDGNRGFLFFQNRSTAANGGSCTAGFGGNCAILGGGGTFVFSGFIYFHNGNGATCGTNTSCLSLAGGSGGNSFTIGNIVVDKISLTGSSGVNMVLNPTVTFSVLRPTLLQ